MSKTPSVLLLASTLAFFALAGCKKGEATADSAAASATVAPAAPPVTPVRTTITTTTSARPASTFVPSGGITANPISSTVRAGDAQAGPGGVKAGGVEIKDGKINVPGIGTAPGH